MVKQSAKSWWLAQLWLMVSLAAVAVGGYFTFAPGGATPTAATAAHSEPGKQKDTQLYLTPI